MKRLILTALVLLLCFVVWWPAGAAAAPDHVVDGDINQSTGSVEISRHTTVNGNVTVNMGEITVLGVVNGNVTGNMGAIRVNGAVGGNVEANMGEVDINGSVAGNVKARMGEVSVDGSVGGNVEADLGSVVIRGSVGGDVISGLGEVRVPGEIRGGISSKGKKVIITGQVDGDVTLTRGIVELGPQAVVRGRIRVEEGMVKLGKGASAGSVEVLTELTEGEVDRLFRDGEGFFFVDIDGLVETIVESVESALRSIDLPSMHRMGDSIRGYLQNMRRFFPIMSFWGWYGSLARDLFNMVVLFAIAALTFTLFPAHVRVTAEAISGKAGAVFGWGLLATALALPLLIFLAITIIGIPLIFVEILFLAVAGILGYTALTQVIGTKIAGGSGSRSVNPLGAIALGVLILGALTMIPFFGGLLAVVLFAFTVGAALTTRFGTLQPQPEPHPSATSEAEPAEAGEEPPADGTEPGE